ncbi:hypothetical protein KL905_005224 [Ogataea polymorpha]|nr:hypothetical protein KL937_005234 [Ogataea polymorpha]KAG7888552.1 hypothetical protein KL908_005099 [Ogataea polymorpha]KAG7914940.1 hypothetical protein KL905_005224 [Ogataea polymorpha]KAG7931358.1 hypothetical protein KL904_005233 [Ogataea polymorpha]
MNAKLQGSSIVTSSWTNFRSKPFASSSALVIMRRKAGIHEGDPAIACGDLKTIIILKKRLKMWASVNVEMLVETMSCDYLHDNADDTSIYADFSILYQGCVRSVTDSTIITGVFLTWIFKQLSDLKSTIYTS